MKKIWILQAFIIRVGVIENPFVVGAGDEGVMAVDIHDPFADDADILRVILKIIKSVAIQRVPGPGGDDVRIFPDEVGCLSVRVQGV